MRMNHLKLVAFVLVICTLNSYAQEPVEAIENSELETAITAENNLLYETNWKLVKMEPAFSDNINLELSFEKATNQLKVIKQVTSTPKLNGTKLITTKNETINFYQWSYVVKEAEYEGDDVKSIVYDYESFELKVEGYTFKIFEISENSLVLSVVKAPKVIFGNSIFNVDKIYFTKK